jgi:hypothetical protein
MEEKQKKIEEVTLYNFVSLRSPQNREKGDEDMKIDFIFCDVVKSKEEIQNVIDARNFESYDAILEHPEIKRTVEVGKILNEYKYKEIDFYRIHQKLLTINFDEGCKKEILQITWKALVKLTKFGGELKFKEALINILRIFHIKEHIKLISKPEYKEDIPFFNRLISAQVVIPQELLPKSETFFFGERLKQFQIPPYSKERAKNNLDIACVNFEIANLNLGTDAENKKKADLIAYKAQNIFLRKTEESEYDIYITPIYSSVIINNNKGAVIISFNDLFFKENKAIKSARAIILDKEYLFGISDINNPESTTELIFELNEEVCFEIIQKGLNELIVSSFIKSVDDSVYEYEVKVVKQENNNQDSETVLFYGDGELIIDDGTDFYGNVFAPSGYGIKQLGISEYRKVVSTISRYVPAEVAKIENVMASEYREMATVKELTKEISDFEATENSNETQIESISTDRFQMQNEIAQMFANENTSKFDTKASYGADSTKLEISYGTSTKDSKNESNRQAVTNAKEITNKAVEKIFTKVRKERTVKVTEKFTESNKHGFDNRGNANHVSGVYRHINAVYRNQIYNYGRRVMYEFAIPEPALFHILAVKYESFDEFLKSNPAPTNPQDLIENYTQLNKDNYLAFEKIFGLSLEKFPDNQVKTKPFSMPSQPAGSFSTPFEIEVPDGFIPSTYLLTSIKPGIAVHSYSNNPPAFDEFLEISLNDLILYYYNWGLEKGYPGNPNKSGRLGLLPNSEKLIVKIKGFDIYSYNLNLEITFAPSQDIITKWKIDQFEKIINKYSQKLNEYKDKIEEFISNSNNSKEIDKDYIQHICLRKQCISYLISDESQNSHRKMGQDMFVEKSRDSIKALKINMNHKLNEYTAFARFLEQAFEWNIMSYSYYPFYWADINEWERMYKINDVDDDFNKFLKAGMARVIVSVRPGFEKAVMQYMLTGKIWEGGEMPTYGSSLFLSIAAEINENPEYKIKHTWETILPTNLIALQSSGVAINQEGLPNLEKSQDLVNMVSNSSKFPTRKKFLGLF